MRPLTRIELHENTLTVDATLIAAGLGIDVAEVQPLMRAGKITSLCERGVGRDAGRQRLTFFHDKGAFAVVIDAAGQVIADATREATPRRG
jgi:hypothetical protein